MINVDNLLIPKSIKKTTKYTEAQYENIRILYRDKVAIREIERMTGISRRMIQFTLFPERLVLAKKNFAIRQKTGRYKYPTEVQSAKVRAVRERKKALLKDGLLVKRNDKL